MSKRAVDSSKRIRILPDCLSLPVDESISNKILEGEAMVICMKGKDKPMLLITVQTPETLRLLTDFLEQFEREKQL